MNKKMRFLAVITAFIMLVRYSEVGMLAANVANQGMVYQNKNRNWYSMIAQDIQLYYGTFYQGGIHSTDTEVSWEQSIQNMLYDRGEFVNLYDAYHESTHVETDVYSYSNLFINSSDIIVSGIAGARLSHKINGDNFVLERNGILYTAGENITINASDVKIAGLVYAPEGTVTVNADTVELSGLIVAEKIVVNAGEIKEQPDRDLKAVYDEIHIEFYPEILVTSVEEENQIEIYGGNINVRNMEIYTRENRATEFQKIYETKGNEYKFLLSETVQEIDIRVKCTNVFGEEEWSNIESLARTEEGLEDIVIDSDEDGLPDGYEIWDLQTDPYNADSDRDGLPDGYEVLYSHTDPLQFDSNTDRDGDGLSALEEYEKGTNPLYADTDFDGINDGEDIEPLTTEALADQSDYQSSRFEPELGIYDHKKVYIDVNGNRQVQIFNRITKEEYYDDNAGTEFLRVKDADSQVETVIFADGEEADIKTYQYDSEGRKTVWAVNGDVYQYEYNNVKNTADTYLNNQFYNRVTYDENENAVKMEYANEDVIDYEYYQYNEDSLLKSVRLNGEKTFEYEYDGNLLVQVEDFLNDTSYELKYDEENNLTGYKAGDGLEKRISYSKETDIYTESSIYQGEERTVTLYTAEAEDGIQLHALLPNGTEIVTESSETKAARYLTETGNSILLDEKEADENSLVISLANLLGTYEYEYDENGNLKTVYENSKKIYDYIYDKNQQLIQYYDYEAGIVSEYSYDNNYNILKSVLSDLSGNKIEEKLYGYGEDTTLGLQKYHGKDIFYDESGNPIKYYNGWEMSWNSGRMLESITNGESVISYRYNKDGIRIGKTVNGIETEYLLDENNKMIGEKCGEDIIWYLYDSGDEISGFEWNGTDYYYVKNGVGDVQGIADKDGTVRCMYDYDVWGKLTDMTGDKELGKRNPVRYRGYYYDEETGLYYLNTRYYDSEVKRFLNRDMLDNETNLYQYCYNNPVLYSDESGMAAYGCSDVNLTVINNVSGYIRRDDQLNNSQECMARYHNGSQYAYFNCYLWTLNILVVDKNTFNVEQIAMNEIGIMGTPGYWCNDIRRLKTGDKLNQLEGYVKRDLTALKYKVQSITQTTPSYSLSRHALAFKLRTNPWDYHFMRLQKGEGKWSFKAGWKGPAFWINGKTPNQVTWTEYKCYYSRPVWENVGVAYNSALWYITYK